MHSWQDCEKTAAMEERYARDRFHTTNKKPHKTSLHGVIFPFSKAQVPFSQR